MRPSLWAFSLGTGLVTELVPDVSQIAVLLQDELPYLFIAASKIIDIDGVDAYQFPLPELCLIENRCQNLQFSPDGRYLAYTAIIDPEIGCGSDGAEIHVWDVNTEEMVQRITGAGFAQWISESMFQYGRSGCEAGNTSLWDMKGRNSIGLGRGGITFWAPDRSSLAGYETTFFGFHADFWMYNIEDNQLFEPHQGEGGRYDTLCWKPDGSQLAYTWQEFQPPSSYEFIIGPRQLWGMDAESSDQQPLLQSEEFNYFIASGNEREWECQWREDWLQVREVPYTPVSTTLEPDDWGPLYCPLRGVCSTEKALAINVDSGEVKEWSALSQEFPTPLESGPDLASEPVFVSPDNFFALYSGMNNKGLWYVSEQGESYLLIPDGFNFIYLDD